MALPEGHTRASFRGEPTLPSEVQLTQPWSEHAEWKTPKISSSLVVNCTLTVPCGAAASCVTLLSCPRSATSLLRMWTLLTC